MQKTRIICTIGPATESYEMLRKMYDAGMDIVRLNMSHGTHESHTKVIKHIKTLNKKVEFPIPILLDTQGPEIRTGDLVQDLNLQEGTIVSIAARGPLDVEESSIHINYAEIMESVNVGDKITVDNGLINFEILEKRDRLMQCRVIDGGVLKSKRHVNLPGIRVNLPAITQKDEQDIAFGLAADVDFIALSFVREAEDIRRLRHLMGHKAGRVKIIAKIEDQEGVRNLEDIIQEADGIMVARGDLGAEINLEDLPNVQRRIVRLCAEYGKRVIVATHLLESMIHNPIPTRAEVTDVANAVYEEVDAVMLSGETTVGKYPIKCVEHLRKIAIKTEAIPGLQFAKNLQRTKDKQQLAIAAVQLAGGLQAKGIVVITRRGIMADFVSNCRPFFTNIYAFTNMSQSRRTMTLNRGVFPFRINFSSDPEKTLQTAFRILKEREHFQMGEKVVIISDVLAQHRVDSIQIRDIP
ncbi:pyruvate kinase [Candidatus Nitronereus thalassa]|uniref:Pyruvate kinase n=1 Tax=Candidatus Nitronereus thalassa TaxID=3020898 RepID=A0ABU3KDG6_9BACT|nr:pyruvate kinase [Candidatus Nitronereus thalassa]MDT7044288.1 pyruvate kinase [Candidatus Nitronereus thalassa]